MPRVQAWAASIAKPKLAPAPPHMSQLRAAVEAADYGRMRDAYQIAGKKARGEQTSAVRKDIVAAVVAEAVGDAADAKGAPEREDAIRDQVPLSATFVCTANKRS
jgi:polyribonucleotide nucleotidyltransferase